MYAPLDLHANNNYLVVIDEQDQVVYRRKQANELGPLLKVLETFRPQLAGIVVESTYNWYWLVDGLMEAGWRVHLANTAGSEQYAGIKHSNDWSDAQWLAHLLRLGILPEGYIYPRAERAVRDLLRERWRLVQERSWQVLSIEGIFARQRGVGLSRRQIGELDSLKLEQSLGEDRRRVAQTCAVGMSAMCDLRRGHPLILESSSRQGFRRIIPSHRLF